MQPAEQERRTGADESAAGAVGDQELTVTFGAVVRHIE